MASPLDEFEKRLKPFAKRLLGVSKKDVDYRINGLKTFAVRIGGQTEDFAEQVNTAMQAGIEGKSPKDFAKDKDVRKCMEALRVTHETIRDEIDALSGLSKDGPKLKGDMKKLELDLGKIKPANPAEKKTHDRLKKELADLIEAAGIVAGAESRIPKEARDVLKRKVDDFLGDGLKAAEKMPKKAPKELPRDFEKTGLAKLQKQLSDFDRQFKRADKELADMLAELKTAEEAAARDPRKAVKPAVQEKPRVFVESLAVTGAEIADIDTQLQKGLKDNAAAVKKAGTGKDISALAEQARRLATNFKTLARTLAKKVDDAEKQGARRS